MHLDEHARTSGPKRETQRGHAELRGLRRLNPSVVELTAALDAQEPSHARRRAVGVIMAVLRSAPDDVFRQECEVTDRADVLDSLSVCSRS